MKITNSIFMLSLLLFFTNQNTYAFGDATKSIYELGMGSIIANNPDYPAAEQNHSRVLILPYGAYRGDVFRASRDGGVSASVYRDATYEFALSVAGGFNSDSSKNDAREGMSDLHYTFEFGPKLKISYENKENIRHQFQFNIPLRLAFSTNGPHTEERGYVFNPYFVYKYKASLFAKDTFRFSIGSTIATKKLHQYFYEVKAEDVTAGRALYEADGGYLGTSIGASYSIQIEDLMFYFLSSIKLHHGAINEKSPLFKKKTNYLLAAGFLWVFWKSEEKASW